jgi:DNA-binding CsgD family transcriptional regulator
MMLAGLAPKNIAMQLGLSVYTVREHIETVYRKFGVNGRDELMSKFISAQANTQPSVRGLDDRVARDFPDL